MRQADNPGGSVSAAELTARVACALLLVPVLLSPAYEVANWPDVNSPTLVGVLIVAGLLGLTAGPAGCARRCCAPSCSWRPSC